MRDDALETLAEADGVRVSDETGFLKPGKASCGVARQSTGSAGKITNCQLGVFAADVSTTGHAFIDRRLYLPKAWTGDPERLAAAHVPEDVRFATKPHLAVAMIEAAINAGVPFSGVAADRVYRVGAVEMAWRRVGKGYVLGVARTEPFSSWDKPEPVSGTAQESAAALPASAWVRLSAGAGTTGPRLSDGASVGGPTARRGTSAGAAPSGRSGPAACWTRGLLVRRSRNDGTMAFVTTWCPQGTPLAVLVEVEGRRWASEDAFETAKTALGLAHNETRSWHGWHRHVSLVMLALAMLMVIRHKADTLTPPQKSRAADRRRPWCDWSLQEIRRMAWR